MADHASVVLSGRMTGSQYRTLHQWVERQLGKPSECENCSTTEASRFHWANISGDYLKDTSDWARLCPRCHAIFDGQEAKDVRRVKGAHCKLGHPFAGDNLAMKRQVSRGRTLNTQVCKTCRARHSREHYARLKAKEQL